MKNCIKCKEPFKPSNDKILICKACLKARRKITRQRRGLQPLVYINDRLRMKKEQEEKDKAKAKRLEERKKQLELSHCVVCNREFKKEMVDGKQYYVRVDGKYCTRWCKDSKRRNSGRIITVVKCKLCEKECISLASHLTVVHNMSMSEYENIK